MPGGHLFEAGAGGHTFVGASGGGGGGVSSVAASAPLTGGGTGAVTVGFDLTNTAFLGATSVAAIGAIASDGGDGDVTISGTVTLTRDMYYNNLTVSGTGVLIARAWRIFARTVTVQSGGIIHWDGADASGATGGAAFTTGSLGPNIAGVNGGTGVGTAGNTANSCFLPRSGVLDGTIFKGGAGGASGTPNAGGAGGTIGVFSSSRLPRSNPTSGAAASSSAIGQITPGSSGGAGGGDGAASGGGSGASGGYGFIMAGSVSNSGTIRSAGGAGGAATGGNGGGGGGGAGGPIEITCGTYSGNVPTVTGGAGGAKAGTGVAGTAGTPGDYFINQYKAA